MENEGENCTGRASARSSIESDDITSNSDYDLSDDENSICLEKCYQWFMKYADPDTSNIIGPEGIEHFCRDINVETDDPVTLVIAWKMKAVRLGYLTKEEWMRGLEALECDSVRKLKDKLHDLRMLLKDPTTKTFESIYTFAFDFAKDIGERTLSMDTALALLDVFIRKFWKVFHYFEDFLKQTGYRNMTKDQWTGILSFCCTVKDDMDNYREEDVWPVLLDEFVVWYKKLEAEGHIESSAI